MQKTKRFASIWLAIMLFCGCFFFTSCKTDDKTAGSYYLIEMSYVEDNTTVTVKFNLLLTMLTRFSMKLVLHENGRAEMIEETQGISSTSKGTWAERENGDVELLFEDQTTIAKRVGKKLIVEDEISSMIFQKPLFDF